MAEIVYDEKSGEWAFRQKLRSPYIDYCHGWFFVTIQVAHNKSVFGAIVGERCVLNELGEAVKAAWLTEPKHVAGLELFDFQVMPNHFHALLYYDGRGGPESGGRGGPESGGRGGPESGGRGGPESGGRGGPPATSGGRATAPCGGRATAPGRCGLLPAPLVAAQYARDPHARDLPYVIGLFKSWTTKLYHRLKAAGKCIDIGPQLWQESFYDELVRTDRQFADTAAYIRNNPRNWNLDRFGEVTSYAEGNLALLQNSYVAYLSSEGYVEGQGALPMTKWGGRSGSESGGRSGPPATSGGRATAPGRCIISTFTSYYERQLLDRCLKSGRRFIWVCPGGFNPSALAKTAAARTAGLALLLSPVAPNTGVNKQRANWCNQFVVRNAEEIWVGHVRSGGSLESILKGILI